MSSEEWGSDRENASAQAVLTPKLLGHTQDLCSVRCETRTKCCCCGSVDSFDARSVTNRKLVPSSFHRASLNRDVSTSLQGEQLDGLIDRWRRRLLPSMLTYPTSNHHNFLSPGFFLQKKGLFVYVKERHFKRFLILQTRHWRMTRTSPLQACRLKQRLQQCRVACCGGQRSVLWQLIGTWQYIGHDCLTGSYIYAETCLPALLFLHCQVTSYSLELVCIGTHTRPCLCFRELQHTIAQSSTGTAPAQPAYQQQGELADFFLFLFSLLPFLFDKKKKSLTLPRKYSHCSMLSLWCTCRLKVCFAILNSLLCCFHFVQLRQKCPHHARHHQKRWQHKLNHHHLVPCRRLLPLLLHRHDLFPLHGLSHLHSQWLLHSHQHTPDPRHHQAILLQAHLLLAIQLQQHRLQQVHRHRRHRCMQHRQLTAVIQPTHTRANTTRHRKVYRYNRPRANRTASQHTLAIQHTNHQRADTQASHHRTSHHTWDTAILHLASELILYPCTPAHTRSLLGNTHFICCTRTYCN